MLLSFIVSTGNIDFTSLPTTSRTLDEASTVQCSPVSIQDDNIVELDETFSVLLSTSNEFADITQASTTVTIADDDTVSIGWTSTIYTSNEPDTAVSVCAEITDGVIARPVTAFYSTVDGTALGEQGTLLIILTIISWLISSYTFSCKGQEDFTTVLNMVVNFQPSSTSVPQCRQIQIEDDSILENTENFQVILDTSDRAVEIDSSTATVNILDNDRKPKTVHTMSSGILSLNTVLCLGVTIGFSEAVYAVSESAESTFICVDLIGASQRSVIVTLFTADSGSQDFQLPAIPISVFQSGQSQVCTSVSITNDAIVEGLESFTLELSTTDPAVDNNFRMRALLNITDNDSKLIVG